MKRLDSTEASPLNIAQMEAHIRLLGVSFPGLCDHGVPTGGGGSRDRVYGAVFCGKKAEAIRRRMIAESREFLSQFICCYELSYDTIIFKL